MVLSAMGVILLLLFGSMFQNGAISFQLASLENGWDAQEKAKACYSGAIIYAATMIISVLYRIYARKEAAKLSA
jgi:hypothetical protein